MTKEVYMFASGGGCGGNDGGGSEVREDLVKCHDEIQSREVRLRRQFQEGKREGGMLK